MELAILLPIVIAVIAIIVSLVAILLLRHDTSHNTALEESQEYGKKITELKNAIESINEIKTEVSEIHTLVHKIGEKVAFMEGKMGIKD